MAMIKGDRVGAMLGSNSEAKVIRWLGYGAYQGEEVPPEEIGGFNIGLPNPKILLDSGKVVWGCECWWGPEPAMRRKLALWEQGGYKLETVDIDDARAAAEQRVA